jgi:hypothetical protein
MGAGVGPINGPPHVLNGAPSTVASADTTRAPDPRPPQSQVVNGKGKPRAQKKPNGVRIKHRATPRSGQFTTNPTPPMFTTASMLPPMIVPSTLPGPNPAYYRTYTAALPAPVGSVAPFAVPPPQPNFNYYLPPTYAPPQPQPPPVAQARPPPPREYQFREELFADLVRCFRPPPALARPQKERLSFHGTFSTCYVPSVSLSHAGRLEEIVLVLRKIGLPL